MDDFYCEQALTGKTPIQKVVETEHVLAFHHTQPFWPVHIVVIPKKHISSLLTLTEADKEIFWELIQAIQKVSGEVIEKHGACRVVTNLGEYQDSKHLHWHIPFGEPIR